MGGCGKTESTFSICFCFGVRYSKKAGINGRSQLSTGYVWSEKIRKVRGGRTKEEVEAECGEFVFYSGLDGQPMECAEKRSCVITFACFQNKTCCRVLKLLEFVQEIVRGAG